MSDDLTVQPIETKKGNYARAGLFLGAVGGGYAGINYASKYQLGIPTANPNIEVILALKPDFYDKKIANDPENKKIWEKLKSYAEELANRTTKFNDALSAIKNENPDISVDELKSALKNKGVGETLVDTLKPTIADAKNEVGSGLKNLKCVHNKWINGAVAAVAGAIALATVGSLFKKD